jgi:integral membrane protein (TIGR01906 family)
MAEKKPLRILGAMAGALFILCLPIFLLTSNLRWAVNEPRLYQYSFDKYEVSEETGIGDEELLAVARGLIHYFNSGERGEQLGLFNEREVAHLGEVRGLIGICYHLQEGTFGYLAAFAIGCFIWQRGRFWPRLERMAFWGSALTLALLTLLGIGALVNFQWLFLGFHQLFFGGDSWMLDPSDYLIRMFPQGFFYDATLFIAGATALEAVVIGGIGGLFMLRGKRAGRKAP